MRRLFFQKPNATVITAIMTGQTPESLIGQSRGAEFDGADAIAVDLCDLRPEFRNRESLERVINAVNLPFMFYFYRNDRHKIANDDESRQGLLLAAAEAGGGMIDVMGDLYAPSPNEITRNPEAIAKQKQLIAKIHEIGAQVVMSSHPNKAMSAEAILEQLRAFEQRGVDVVKIVTTADTDEEFTETVRATMLLHRELKTPFIHLCNGRFGRLHRYLGLKLGVSITFAVHNFEADIGFTQPSVRSMKSVAEIIPWHIGTFCN